MFEMQLLVSMLATVQAGFYQEIRAQFVERSRYGSRAYLEEAFLLQKVDRLSAIAGAPPGSQSMVEHNPTQVIHFVA